MQRAIAIVIGSLSEARIKLFAIDRRPPAPGEQRTAATQKHDLVFSLTPACAQYLKDLLGGGIQQHFIDVHGEAETVALFRSLGESILGVVVIKLPGVSCTRFSDLKSKDQILQCPKNLQCTCMFKVLVRC